MTTKEQEFMTGKQLCERWRCTDETLRNYRRSGKLHPVRPGHKWLYPLSEITKIEIASASQSTWL